MFTAKTFSLPALEGISEKNISEHLKLYEGYVRGANFCYETVQELRKDYDENAYLIGELTRRFSFEFNGMRNHECYFGNFENGSETFDETSLLGQKIIATFGSYQNFVTIVTQTALTRGIGWVFLSHDTENEALLIHWVDEQHIGQLGGITPLIALDMWEHAFVYDYPTSEKKKYIEAFFKNLNWKTIENRYSHTKNK